MLNRQKRFRLRRFPVASLCAGTLLALGKEPSALTVSFVCGRTMRRLNSRYRRRDYPTDVLSFSYGNESDEGMPYLGDIVIAVDVACSQAKKLRIPAGSEIQRLIVHGVLHLLGYDHETDSGEMAQMQARLLRRKYVADAGTVSVEPNLRTTRPTVRRRPRC